LESLKAGDIVEVEVGGGTYKIELREDIPYGHKVAIRDLERGSKIIKYGEVIGVATEDIAMGSHVHVHNIKSLRY
jgi:altronate dehydratase